MPLSDQHAPTTDPGNTSATDHRTTAADELLPRSGRLHTEQPDQRTADEFAGAVHG